MLITLFYTSGLTEEIDGVISIDSIEEIEDDGVETYIYITSISTKYQRLGYPESKVVEVEEKVKKIRADRLTDIVVNLREVTY